MAWRKFYVTGRDGSIPPIIAYGTSRIDALANCGFTVWEAVEYEESFAPDGKPKNPLPQNPPPAIQS